VGTSLDQNKIRLGVQSLLQGLGCDPSDPNFRETPNRVTRSYQEIFRGVGEIENEISSILEQTFPCTHDQMVLARGVEVFGMCPHHLLPVRYEITIAYIPTTSVLGISKLCRIAQLLTARPVLQEQMVNDVADVLMRVSGCLGAGVIASGEHLCMRMRGVRQSQATVVTSSLRGCFLDDPRVRSEFMALR